jgi:antitoxin ParD1/3/4
LRLLKEKDEVHQRKLDELRREIQSGVDQADRGQVSAFTKETLKEIKADGRKRLSADRKPRSS